MSCITRCSNKVGPGHIRHLDYGQFTLAELGPPEGAGTTESMKSVADDFTAAGITVHLAENLAVARWKKLVWNIPFNGLSVVLDATTKELVQSQNSLSLIRQLMKEVIEGAGACGYAVEERLIDEMVEASQSMIPYRPSMKIDFDEHRPMEIDAIYGVPIRMVEQAGKKMFLVEMLYRELCFLNEVHCA